MEKVFCSIEAFLSRIAALRGDKKTKSGPKRASSRPVRYF